MNAETKVNTNTKLVAIIPWAIAAYLAFNMIGCAGMGIRAEAYRIDQTQSSSKTYNKPLKCLFIPCADEVSNERSGS
jgi:hypothetical protein